MRIAIIGGRLRDDKPFIDSVLEMFVKDGDSIISGGAKGVDTIARLYAESRSLPFVEYLPDSPGMKQQLMERNTKIAEACDVVLAFPHKDSKGTFDTVRKALKLGKRVIIFRP